MGHPVMVTMAAPRIKAVCPVCGRDLQCEVAFRHENRDDYTIVVSAAGRDHIATHYQ